MEIANVNPVELACVLASHRVEADYKDSKEYPTVESLMVELDGVMVYKDQPQALFCTYYDHYYNLITDHHEE